MNSLEEADGKIDELAKTGKLDPALLLTMAKAYAAAKETDKTQEEVKDIMAHLYFKARLSRLLSRTTQRVSVGCSAVGVRSCQGSGALHAMCAHP